jgi:hypothetical protein
MEIKELREIKDRREINNLFPNNHTQITEIKDLLINKVGSISLLLYSIAHESYPI